jgi:hypothetical protein
LKIGIHQPNYLPYLGFFDKMEKSDVFVIYDDAQFSKSDFHHRNKIRIYHEWRWLTVPVDKKKIQIKDIKIRNDFTVKDNYWFENHFQAIRENYGESKFFHRYEDTLQRIYSGEHDYLIDLNIEIINMITNELPVKKKIIMSSEFGFSSTGTERIIEIVEAIGGDTYISGPGGHSYLETQLFEEHNIKLEFQDFHHPEYPQCYENFVPNMAAIDALFILGKLPLDRNNLQ